jgi:hypothetical protein
VQFIFILGVISLSTFTINIDNAEDLELSIYNKSKGFVISGTTNAPKGTKAELRLGIHRVSSVVVGGKFSFTFNRKVNSTTYNFTVTLIDAKDRKIKTSKQFTLNVIDLMAPAKISTFVLAKGRNNSFKLSWVKPFEEFKIDVYSVFKNGQFVTSTKQNSYNTLPMDMNQVDAYRVYAIDDSNNIGEKSFGYAVSRKTWNQDPVPALTTIDKINKKYTLLSSVVQPVTVTYAELFGSSDICDISRASVTDNSLKFIVTSVVAGIGLIETMKTSIPSSKKTLAVGDVIGAGDVVMWTPTENFTTIKDIASFKALNSKNLQSTTSAILKVDLF